MGTISVFQPNVIDDTKGYEGTGFLFGFKTQNKKENGNLETILKLLLNSKNL